MRPTIRRFIRILNGLLIGWILIWITLISYAFFDADYLITYITFWVMIVLLILGILLFLVLFVEIALREWRQLVVLRVPFVWLSIFFILILLFGNMRKHYYWQGSIPISIQNESGMPLDFISIYGRHDELEIRSLQNTQSIDSVFYGHKIDYDTRNNNENCIYIRFRSNGKWHKHIVAGKWRYFNNSIGIGIHSPDSVSIKLW